MIIQLTSKGVNKRSTPYNTNEGSAYHWTYVMRYPNTEVRELIAEGMEHALSAKAMIGYDNGSKSTKLFTDTKPHYDCKRLKKKSYANCCNLVSVACRYAGIKTPKSLNSLTLHKTLTNYGFKRIKFEKGMKLYRGDILVSSTRPKPHTAVQK